MCPLVVLQELTQGFSASCAVGEGGFATVYRAELPPEASVSRLKRRLDSAVAEPHGLRCLSEGLGRSHAFRWAAPPAQVPEAAPLRSPPNSVVPPPTIIQVCPGAPSRLAAIKRGQPAS